MSPPFITAAQRAELLVNGARSARGEDIDPPPVVKLFTPDAGATWPLSSGCNVLWIVHAPFLSGACGCGIISLPRSGEPMRTDPRHAALQVPPVERPDEARLALRRATQPARAGFAEMDRLLARAERLISQQRSSHWPRSL